MRCGDPVLAVIRVLALLHGLPALLVVGYGLFLATLDLAAGSDEDWDGFGVLVGGAFALTAAVPLLLAAGAVVSARGRRVRVYALLLGVTSVGVAVALEVASTLLVVPGALLVVLAVAHALTADADPPRPSWE